MKFITSKIFLWIVILLLFIIFINDKHLSKDFLTYVVLVVMIFVYWKVALPIISEKMCLDKVFVMVKIHETALAIQRNRLIKRDIYGNESNKDWKKEIDNFLEKTIYPKLDKTEKEVFEYIKPYEKVVKFIDEIARNKNIFHEQNIQFYETMTGEEYELLCKEILNKSGWHVETTKRTGDQGVDLIATKDNIRVVIQCKRYSNNIGNSAVQEIISGKIIYKANFGVVVSNVPYTKSAKELASVANIKLLHHYHLLHDNFYYI